MVFGRRGWCVGCFFKPLEEIDELSDHHWKSDLLCILRFPCVRNASRVLLYVTAHVLYKDLTNMILYGVGRGISNIDLTDESLCAVQ